MRLQSWPTGIHKKVIVAMSGGVDSSLAAALLKRAGFDVAGVFMKFWANPQNRCCSPESQVKARQVAAKLGIPFYVFNFEKEFKTKVLDCFLKEYKIGLTPNPCVVCNKEIKFGLLLEKALSLGANFVATGHYACLKNSRLFQAKDKEKDQSYFLWQLNQEQLRRVLFPIGNYTKPEVRKMAEKFGLPTYATPDSQEICFVPKTINDFLAKYIKSKAGKIVCAPSEGAQACAPSEGAHLGRHQGLAFYTIGQRKGIGLPQGPYWVLAKDQKRNVLVVTKNKKDLLKKELIFKNVNWLIGKTPKLPIKIKAKIRYRSNLAAAALFRKKIVFDKAQRAITPGQSVVFYRGQELLGGAIIC